METSTEIAPFLSSLFDFFSVFVPVDTQWSHLLKSATPNANEGCAAGCPSPGPLVFLCGKSLGIGSSYKSVRIYDEETRKLYTAMGTLTL
jgi:hypothetical protein